MKRVALAGALVLASPVARAGTAWREEAKLTATAPKTTDATGGCAAASGDFAFLGAPGLGPGGSVLVWKRTGPGVWAPAAPIVPAGLAAGAYFGTSCAAQGDRLVVGARGSGTAGTAYVFALVNGTYQLEQQLAPTDGEAEDRFGISVAIDATTVLVGADNKPPSSGRGAAYAFTKTPSGWSAPQKLLASDGATTDAFGWSVAVDGSSLVVGALYNNQGKGAAYVFTKGATWTQQAKLFASDGVMLDSFGYAVALRGDVAVAGAATEVLGKGGAAYVFTRTGTAWTEKQKLAAETPAGADRAGSTLAFTADGQTLFVGARSRRTGRGAVIPFVLGATSWTRQPELLASDGADGSAFGAALGVSPTALVIGAPSHAGGRGQGYAFRFALGNGDACTAGSACLSGACVDGVCCDTACGGGRDDDCQACTRAKGAKADGTCGPALPSVVCRAAASACDVAETCDGIALACPADAVAANGAACAGGTCRAGVCEAGPSSTTPPGSDPSPAPAGVAPESGCSTAPGHPLYGNALLFLLALALLAFRRRAPRSSWTQGTRLRAPTPAEEAPSATSTERQDREARILRGSGGASEIPGGCAGRSRRAVDFGVEGASAPSASAARARAARRLRFSGGRR